MNKALTESDIAEAIAQELATHTKTSPTAVAERLGRAGFSTLKSTRSLRTPKPTDEAFDLICEVARRSFTFRLHGNVRFITAR